MNKKCFKGTTMYYVIFLAIIIGSYLQVMAESKHELGKQFVEKLKEYHAGLEKYRKEKGDDGGHAWCHEHQKEVYDMIELFKKGADLSVLIDDNEDNDDDEDDEDADGDSISSAGMALQVMNFFLCHSKPLYDEFARALINSNVFDDAKMRVSVLGRLDSCGIRKLLRQGLKLTYDDDEIVGHVLHSDDDILELVLNAGANPNAAPWQDGTVLMSAVSNNNVIAVKALLNHINKIDEKHHSYKGQTPLHYSFFRLFERLNDDYLRDKHTIIQLLLDKGCAINSTDEEGETPLMIAIKGHDSYDVEPDQRLIDLVISHGADPLAKDRSGLSVLHYASHKGLHKIIKSLLAAIARYQPEKLADVQSHVQLDVNELLQKNAFYQTVKDQVYGAYDFSRKALALFGTLQIVLALNKKFKLVGRNS